MDAIFKINNIFDLYFYNKEIIRPRNLFLGHMIYILILILEIAKKGN